ncbi:uncharacterized protein LOC136076031 [Hydra vulgaris]|uniref:Uncharacterized protein LOC136076031 n=1 Tax=Hydra vulgaris TaxID=6087 RepID=A0ABM4B9K1_HYDVU
MKSVQTLTLKPLSDTRWEYRVESLKTLKYEYSKVYDALVEIANSSDKKMQSPDYDLSTAQSEIDQLLNPHFEAENTIRPRKKKTLFSYEFADEPILNPETQYVVEVCNVHLDQVLSSLTSRFNQLKELSELFGFLYKIPEVTQNTEALKKHSKDLEVALTEDGHSDVISNQLFDKIKAISSMVPGKFLP